MVRAGTTALPNAVAWSLLCALSIAATMDAVNSTVLVVARGHIMGGVHATPDDIAWVNMAYLAAKLTALPVAAHLSMRIAASPLILAATSALLFSAVAIASTTDLHFLIGWRIVQGGAGGLLLVVGQAVIFQVFPISRQGLPQAIFAFSTIMAPTTLTPALQGSTIDNLSWPWIFLANVPLAAAGFIALPLLRHSRTHCQAALNFDWKGLSVFAVAMTSFVYVTQEGSRHNWFDETKIAACSALAGTSLLAFVAIQMRTRGEGRLFDLSVFRDPHFGFGFIVSFVAGGALLGSAFVIPAFASAVLNFSPSYAGFMLLPSGLFVCLGLLTAGSIIHLRGVNPAKPIPLGVICFMISMWLISGSTSRSGLPDLVPALLLRGFGLGLLFVSLTLVTLRDLPAGARVHGIALFTAGRLAGGQIGIALLSAYLDRQNALNRALLSENLSVGNPALSERQEAIAGLLIARGYPSEEARFAAIEVIQKTFAQQVATLSFNECFLAIALLFVAAAPLLIATNVLLLKILRPHVSQQMPPAGPIDGR